jgi:hypothetical protein
VLVLGPSFYSVFVAVQVFANLFGLRFRAGDVPYLGFGGARFSTLHVAVVIGSWSVRATRFTLDCLHFWFQPRVIALCVLRDSFYIGLMVISYLGFLLNGNFPFWI